MMYIKNIQASTQNNWNASGWYKYNLKKKIERTLKIKINNIIIDVNNFQMPTFYANSHLCWIFRTCIANCYFETRVSL